ncbi:hypothetical protein KSP39_PZI018934 [Platanthera zijinensis]|uniref:Uncharacterized protein n=1 Tax=Platanthera zijinensis TaxID=2320716 RepID=A0AAP0B388_9ASPA
MKQSLVVDFVCLLAPGALCSTRELGFSTKSRIFTKYNAGLGLRIMNMMSGILQVCSCLFLVLSKCMETTNDLVGQLMGIPGTIKSLNELVANEFDDERGKHTIAPELEQHGEICGGINILKCSTIVIQAYFYSDVFYSWLMLLCYHLVFLSKEYIVCSVGL